MKTLSIIGCGKVGQTLSRLWREHGVFSIGQILNRSLSSGEKAAEVVGAGTPIASYKELKATDIFMIATPDAAIEFCARQLADAGLIEEHTIVFHCSGAYGSDLLNMTKAGTASLHAVKSFVDAETSTATFAGTYCALEGAPAATALLKDALEKIGAHTLTIKKEDKTIYHAASVFASNYLASITDAAVDCLEKCGIDRKTGLKALLPIIRGTVDNMARIGPAEALTGPIARGDAALVRRQIEALSDWNSDLAALYAQLGLKTAGLARKKSAPPALDDIEKILDLDGNAGL